MKLKANGITIEYEDTHPGDTTGRPVVLLVMGLGMQLIAWPPALVNALTGAGYRVIRHDNRDIGLSQHFDELGRPNLLWTGLKFRLGLKITPPYRLADLARDALGLLDALGVGRFHLAGISMGGMISQWITLIAPQRVLSLTSIMSSSGAPGLPQPKPAIVKLMVGRPGEDRDAYIAHTIKLFKAIGSPAFPYTDLEIRERVTTAVDRNLHPQGVARQMVAMVTDSERADALTGIRAPTLVIHGKEDPLVPFGCGEDTARRIPGARLVPVEGMGHDLAPGVVVRIVPLMLAHFRASAPVAPIGDNRTDEHS